LPKKKKKKKKKEEEKTGSVSHMPKISKNLVNEPPYLGKKQVSANPEGRLTVLAGTIYQGLKTPARQATFHSDNKYGWMELSNVIKKILRVVNSLSHGLSKIDTHCHQGHQGCIFAYLGRQMSSAVVTLVIKQDLPRCLLGYCPCCHLVVLVVTWSQSWDMQILLFSQGHQCCHMGR
jgi:hypothetical protein